MAKSHGGVGARLKFAGVCLLAAAATIFFALRFETKAYLTSAPAGNRAARYSRMWFDSADDLVGASSQGNLLTIERGAGTNAAASWRFDLGESADTALWTMSADDSRIAWIAGSRLQCQAVQPGAAAVDIVLPRRALALSLLSNGSAAVIFDDLTVGRWDAATGRALGEWKAPLRSADRVAAEGDYIAFSSADDGSLLVFAFQKTEWIQAQRSIAPEHAERIVIPAPSVAGTMFEGRLRVAGVTLASPGPIRSVAAHRYDVIAAGDFDGIYVLTQDGENYKLADAAPGSLVASGETRFAVSGVEGTRLFTFGVENRLTHTGRAVSLSALGFAVLAAALACGPLMLEALSLIFGGKAKKKRSGVFAGKLEPPPPELVNACASGRMILWAGAGLSAQSGFPLRATFVRMIVENALVEFVDANLAKRLRPLVAAGKHEQAMDELAAAAESAAQRGALISHFTAVSARFAPPSRAHELLARLNLYSAITTNYDILLEQTGDRWASNVRHLGSLDLSERFLLKLYGFLQEPKTALLSRAELDRTLRGPGPKVRDLFAAHPFLFVGCSLDGLRQDLEMLCVPRGQVQPHFAIAAAGAGWEKTAKELAQLYGIKVLPCAEDAIGESLPAFLDALVRGVAETQHPLTAKA